MTPTLYRLKSGQIVANKRMLNVQPFDLLTDLPNNNISVSALGQTGPIAATVGRDGPIEISQFSAQRSEAMQILLEIQDGSATRKLMNAACHIDTIFGSGTQPYYLPEALWLDEGHVINCYAANLADSTNNVRLNFRGLKRTHTVADPDGSLARQRISRREFISMPYFYTFATGGVTLAGGATSSQEIPISAEGYFLVQQITSVQTGDFTLNIINQATNDSIINAPGAVSYEIPHSLLCGTANFAFKLHEPWLIGPGQKIVVNLTNTELFVNTIYLTLGGIFIRQGPDR